MFSTDADTKGLKLVTDTPSLNVTHLDPFLQADRLRTASIVILVRHVHALVRLLALEWSFVTLLLSGGCGVQPRERSDGRNRAESLEEGTNAYFVEDPCATRQASNQEPGPDLNVRPEKDNGHDS